VAITILHITILNTIYQFSLLFSSLTTLLSFTNTMMNESLLSEDRKVKTSYVFKIRDLTYPLTTCQTSNSNLEPLLHSPIVVLAIKQDHKSPQQTPNIMLPAQPTILIHSAYMLLQIKSIPVADSTTVLLCRSLRSQEHQNAVCEGPHMHDYQEALASTFRNQLEWLLSICCSGLCNFFVRTYIYQIL
jgi:hypothetical protein